MTLQLILSWVFCHTVGYGNRVYQHEGSSFPHGGIYDIPASICPKFHHPRVWMGSERSFGVHTARTHQYLQPLDTIYRADIHAMITGCSPNIKVSYLWASRERQQPADAWYQ